MGVLKHCKVPKYYDQDCGKWSFGDDFAKHFIIFGVDNGSSIHTDNRENSVLVLGKEQTGAISGSINFVNYNSDNN